MWELQVVRIHARTRPLTSSTALHFQHLEQEVNIASELIAQPLLHNSLLDEVHQKLARRFAVGVGVRVPSPTLPDFL
jgi:hypothetical protein